jgi:ubiquinone/menaquinone biosynthesis C-methylase UbiE
LNKIEYNKIAKSYAKYRNASPRIVSHVMHELSGRQISRILEIGCGTADYLAVFSKEFNASGCGFDNSEQMLKEGDGKNPGLKLLYGEIEEKFPFNDNGFEFAYSIDVIHYVKNLKHYYDECFRILTADGVTVTVTDSDEDLHNRTMTKYFPESLRTELQRYHSLEKIITTMRESGFKDIHVTHTSHQVNMTEDAFSKYKNKAYSAIRLVSEKSFEKGIRTMKKDMQNGVCKINENYSYVWGKKQERIV